MLVPASILLPTQTQAQETPSLQVINGGTHDVPLKAIQDSDGNIDPQNDFEIEPQNVITVDGSKDFHAIPSEGSLFAIKITDEQRQTTDLQFFKTDGRVIQDLQSKAYLLDIIVLLDGDKYLYETVLAVLAPGQTLNQVNTQNIIQNFASSTSESHTTIVFRDGDNEPPEEELSVCYFHPNDDPHCVPVDGECPEDAPNMNEQGNCHPSGCPDGYSMLDDDETGTCYSDNNVIVCPGSNAKVLDRDDCAIYESPLVEPLAQTETNNDTSDTETEDIIQDEEQTQDKEPEPLDSNCDGDPCTSNCGGENNCSASQKEDSWLSDGPESSPGVPIEEEEPEEEAN
jgi:hypothetical protein